MADDREKLIEELNDIAGEFDTLLEDESIVGMPRAFNKLCGRLNDVIGILEQKVKSFVMEENDNE